MMDTNKRCKITDQISGSQSHGGVRRRRDTYTTSSGSDKKRKFDHGDHQKVIQPENDCQNDLNVSLSDTVVSTPESVSCYHASPSSRFENDFSLDLKVELRFESETSMCSNDGFSKEASASSEICLDSDEMESSSTLKKKTSSKLAAASCRKPITVSNCPTAAEIDEFFSIAEKKEEKRFMDKYNYDIVNDVPMEGRYQWVRLKP
ncbi:cyclin-dependent kinase inhibitor 7-like isoform X1 [Rutidosis leptorrhynchoides]|uniref:cyclin-dependent kinase inhibitor 7-like isoform X1 n=1 Tax=Rutidosis leptorrhynchoides TaxID=125765 RepID=UPI003A99B5FD